MRGLGFLCFAIFGLMASAFASEDSVNLFYFQPQFGLQGPKIFTQGQTSSYSGNMYSAALYYKIGDESFAWAPFVSYGMGTFQNAANSASQAEKLTENTGAAGVKFYFGNWFLAASYSWIKFQDTFSGVTTRTISDSTTGLGGAVGFAFNLSNYIALELSGNIQNANFTPKSGSFSNNAQYVRYGVTLGVSFLLPSSPPKKSYFKTGIPLER